MTLKTVFLYQIGRAEAIRDVASNRAALGIGAGLTLTAAIARQYDQTSIIEAPWWPVGPLLFSLFSSFFVYVVIYPLLLKWRAYENDAWPGFWSQYRVFLGLFWMTSPVAWFYAIPMERMLPPREAAIGNMTLLGIVSIWRIWLLSRAVAVVTGQRFTRVCCAVLGAGCIEMIVVGFLASGSMLSAMGGLMHAPETVVRQSGNVVAIIGAMGLGLAALLIWITIEPSVEERPLPKPSCSNASWTGLIVLWLVWSAVAVVPQIELARTHHAETLLENHRFAETLAYVSSHLRSSFSPSHRIPPDPYRYGVFRQLPGLFEAMNGQEASWVRMEYLRHLEIAFNHRMLRFTPEDSLTILSGLERIPEGWTWIARNRSLLSRMEVIWNANSDSTEAYRELTNRLAQIKSKI